MGRVMTDNNWWRGAVIYQIYPRSFKDSNNDGIGDLPGIIEKLDYVASLGVDAIWLSPFFKSPMKDYGYDVSDYCDVDPMFGTLDDFDRLIKRAHELGIKIILDLVASHTSDQHKWFLESREDRTNDKADWYVWADPKTDGSPPNNWQAFFGGPSWSYNVRRGQYYMHNFLESQPDLNMHNPAVQDAILAQFKFWLDRGVDGFRLDVANCYMHDPLLRDNPPVDDPKPQFFNVDFPTPFTMQDHIYDFSRPENIVFVKRIRALLDQYDNRMSVAEIAFNKDGLGAGADYTRGNDRFHTAYNFSLISGDRASASYIRDALEAYAASDGGWPSWAFSNHDVVRVATRWGGAENTDNPAFIKMLIALLTSLRGTVFLYQGEELGLPEATVPFEKLKDPWGVYLYPKWQGRDGCRTPIPWTNDAMAGFTGAADTWLPIADAQKPLNVAAQEKDPASPLHFTRTFLRWRKNHAALVSGTITFHDTHRDDVLAFTRTHDGQAILCVFNMGEEPVDLTINSQPVTLQGFEAQFSVDGSVAFSSSP